MCLILRFEVNLSVMKKNMNPIEEASVYRGIYRSKIHNKTTHRFELIDISESSNSLRIVIVRDNFKSLVLSCLNTTIK